MSKKFGDILILLSGIILAMCLEYLSPYIRYIINNIVFRNIGLSQQIQDICIRFCHSQNRSAILIVVIIAAITIILIGILIFRRQDKDDEIIKVLKEIRDSKNNVVQQQETTETKPSK